MSSYRVIAEYTDGTREMLSFIGYELTDDELLEIAEKHLTKLGRFDRVKMMQVKE
mgnify:CR=1 FL=1